MALIVTIKKINNLPVLGIAGRIVDKDVKKFSKRLEFLYKKKVRLLIVDLTKANFIDSHGLGILAFYHNLMQREGRDLVVLNANTNPGSYINRLFELTNLKKVIYTIVSLDQLALAGG